MTPTEFKEARLNAGLIQAQVQQLLGVAHIRSIKSWESGRTPISPPVARLMRLLALHGVGALQEIQG